MYPGVVKVSATSDYHLLLEFSNSERGVLDMNPYLTFGVFKKLASPDEFGRVHVSFDTVEWPCGVDLDPAFVYEKASKSSGLDSIDR